MKSTVTKARNKNGNRDYSALEVREMKNKIYTGSEKMLVACEASKSKIKSSFKEVKSKNTNTECLAQKIGKEEENVEEILVCPDIVNQSELSENLMVEVKNETENSGWVGQETNSKERETCKNAESKPAVFGIRDKTECSLENLPVNVEHKKWSDIPQSYKAVNDYLLQKIPATMIENRNFAENEPLDLSCQMPGNILGNIYCIKCQKVVDMSNHKCRADYEYQCKVCSKRFKSDKTLKGHMIFHTNEKGHNCEICGKICVSRSKLVSHLQVHSIEMRYQCSVCNKMFKLEKSLKYHMDVIHAADTTYTCKFCGKICAHRSGLLSHLLVHSDEKIHNCTVCGKGFKTKGDLTKHLRTHNNDKRYKCEICGKCFTQACSLQTHTLLHYGERRHVCHICDKTFTQKGNLHAHLLIHSGQKEYYKCTMCEKTFLRKADLSTHTKAHIIGSVYKCDLCGQTLKMKKYLKRHIVRHIKGKMKKKKRTNEEETNKSASVNKRGRKKKNESVCTGEKKKRGRKKSSGVVGKTSDSEICLENIVKSEADEYIINSEDCKDRIQKIEKTTDELPFTEVRIKEEPSELNDNNIIVEENTGVDNESMDEEEPPELNSDSKSLDEYMRMDDESMDENESRSILNTLEYKLKYESFEHSRENL